MKRAYIAVLLFLLSQISFSPLVAADGQEQDTSAAGLTTTVLLQNEVAIDGQPSDITGAAVLVSPNPDGTGAVQLAIRKNNRAISDRNPLTPQDQSDDLPITAGSGIKWVQLKYRTAGSTRDVLTGACIITRGASGGRDHYLQQVIIRPRSADGRQTQFQAEDVKKPFSQVVSAGGKDQGTAASGYSAANGVRSAGEIKLINDTDDLQEVVITLSNWRYTKNWPVEQGSPITLTGLPPVGYGVAAFNPSNRGRTAIGGDSFQLSVPFEVVITGRNGRYRMHINPLEFSEDEQQRIEGSVLGQEDSSQPQPEAPNGDERESRVRSYDDAFAALDAKGRVRQEQPSSADIDQEREGAELAELEVTKYYARWNYGPMPTGQGKGLIFMQGPNGPVGSFETNSLVEFEAALDMLRYEKPVRYDANRRRFLTGFDEPVGEQEGH